MSRLITDNLKRLGWMFLAVLVGTLLDYGVHLISPAFAVPDYYFRNKIIYAMLWLLVGLAIFWRVRSPEYKALWVTLSLAVILQTHYYLVGYPLWFVLFFALVHFVVFLLPVYVIFRRNRTLFGIS